MISHVTIGITDLERAVGFYSPIFEMLGMRRMSMGPSAPFAMWTSPESFRPAIFLTYPENRQPHDAGNGQMLAFLSPDRATVDQVHALAMSAGGKDEGAPGLRPHYHPNYYGAYFRDLDGNKLCIVCHEAPKEDET